MVRPFVLTALLVSSFSLAAEPSRLAAAHLRLFNGGIHDSAATIRCGDEQSTIALAARGVADVPDAFLDRCRNDKGLAELTLEHDGSIVALETHSTDEGDAQRLLTSHIRPVEACSETVVVEAPLNGCKFGTATVAVDSIPGAAYSWTVDGATVLSGAGTSSINLSLGSNASAAVSVDVTAGNCTSHGSAVIALHDPFAVHATIPAAHAHQPLTITWSYTNGSPQSQTISGTDFGPITLGAADRSYTYTPDNAGSRQFTLDAALQTPPSSRHRAVAKGRTAVSTCATAHMAATYDVGACEPPQITLYAPPLVITGSAVNLAIAPVDGATATWTIHNGTPATGSGNSMTVTAGTVGMLDVTVELTRAGCTSQLVRNITVNDKPVCNNPKVAVSLSQISCGSATVNAAFTGTPPFTGTWSDGVTFVSNGVMLTRTVTVAGTYAIASFQDAACAGTVSGAAVVPAVRPTATYVGKANSCAGQDTYKLQLAGKAPFSLYFEDGTSLVTSSTEVTKPVNLGQNHFYGYDANGCTIDVVGRVLGQPLPRIYMWRQCFGPEYVYPMALIAGVDGTSPYSVTWSDGVTGQSRYVNPTQTQTYSVASVSDAYCSANITPGQYSITAYADPAPDFELTTGPPPCQLAANTVSLKTPPPPGGQPYWSIDHGTILAGQGTSTVTYMANNSDTTVTCTFNFADQNHCPVAKRIRLFFLGGASGTMNIFSTTIRTQQAFQFTVNTSGVQTWSIDDSMNDPITPIGNCGPSCTEMYTSTHGPGTSVITLHLTDNCGNQQTVKSTITILP